jgi:hypothetical protein
MSIEKEQVNDDLTVDEQIDKAIFCTKNEIAVNLLRLGVGIRIIAEATGVHPSTLSMLKQGYETEKRQKIIEKIIKAN